MVSLKDRLRAAVTPGLTVSDMDPNAVTPFMDMGQSMARDMGIQTGKAKQTALARAQEQQMMDQFFDSAFRGAISETDEESEVMLGQWDAVHKQLRSKFPEQRAQAVVLRAQLLTEQRAKAVRDENERIENERLAETEGAAGEKLRYDRNLAMSTDLDKAVRPIDQQIDALRLVRDLNNDPNADNIQRQAAFSNLISTIDPGARRDPDGRYAGANGFLVQLQNNYDRLLGNPDGDAFSAVNNITDTALNRYGKDRESIISSFRNRTEAYKGDWDQVGSVLREYVPEQRGTSGAGFGSPSATSSNTDDSRDPSLLEEAAAGVAATGQTAWQNMPTEVKTGLAAATGLSIPGLVKGAATGAGALLAPAAPFLAGAAPFIFSGMQTAAEDHEATALRPNETPEEYQERLAKYLTLRAGEPIDPGQIRVPRRTNE